MGEYISLIALGTLLVALGVGNIRGNISTIHWYNRRKVSEADRPAYGKWMGLGTILCGAGLMVGARFALAHRAEIEEYEGELASRLRARLEAVPGLKLLGDAQAPRVGVVSFVPQAMDTGELCDALNAQGFALRAGLHCAPSVHQWLGTLRSGACRASVGIYNTQQDVDALADAVERLLSARSSGL